MSPESASCRSRELFLRSQNSDCVEIIELTPLLLGLKNMVVDAKVSRLSTSLEIRVNDPQLVAEEGFLLPDTLARNYTLTLQADLEGVEMLPTERFMIYTIFALIGLLICCTLWCINSFNYRHSLSQEYLGYLNTRNSKKTL